MMESATSPYTENYRDHYLSIDDVYPSVFALKFFLGNNPDLNLRELNFKGKNILDVGFGDGRDLILFRNLGFDVYGVEVDPQVVQHTIEKFDDPNIHLKVGFNDETGFEHGQFDYIYSCAALMYLRNNQTSVHSILKHMYDLLAIGGRILGTFTAAESHITAEAQYLSENRLILKDPYYKQRNGQIYHIHRSAEEVERDLTLAGFTECKVYDFNANWFGTSETAYMFYAEKN